MGQAFHGINYTQVEGVILTGLSFYQDRTGQGRRMAYRHTDPERQIFHGINYAQVEGVINSIQCNGSFTLQRQVEGGDVQK